MTYDLATMMANLRARLQNLDVGVLSDAALAVACSDGRRRLDGDHPNLVDYVITGTGKKWYQLEGIATEWIHSFSYILTIMNPTPDVTKDDDIVFTEQKFYQVQTIAGVEWLRIEDIVRSGDTATVSFSTRWKIKDLDGATTTTLTDQWVSAVEFAAMHAVLRSMEAKVAGWTDPNVPADLMNWNTKQDQYRKAAQDYDRLYLLEVGLDKDKPAGILVRADYDPSLQSGRPYMTHWPRFR